MAKRAPVQTPLFFYSAKGHKDGLKCSPSLGQPELEFSGVKAQVGMSADEPFMSEIGTLFPMALCGRNSL
jgi:hypothetical protein